MLQFKIKGYLGQIMNIAILILKDLLKSTLMDRRVIYLNNIFKSKEEEDKNFCKFRRLF